MIETDEQTDSGAVHAKTAALRGGLPPVAVNRLLAKGTDLIIGIVLLKMLPGLVGVIAGYGYILCSDGISRGRSFGKSFWGLKTIKFRTAEDEDIEDLDDMIKDENDSGLENDVVLDEEDLEAGGLDEDSEIAENSAQNKYLEKDDKDSYNNSAETSHDPSDLKTKIIVNEACHIRDSVIRNIPVALALMIYYGMGSLFLAILILGLEFLIMLGNKNGQRIGDMFASTLVKPV